MAEILVRLHYQIVDFERSGVSCYTGYSDVTAGFTLRIADDRHILQVSHGIRKFRVAFEAGIAIAWVGLDDQHSLTDIFK